MLRRGLAIAVPLLAASAALAQPTYEIVNLFYRSSGLPDGRLAAEPDGRLSGVLRYGGDGFGSLFVLIPDGNGGFTSRTRHVFTGPDGNQPAGGLLLGPNGSLFGTTIYGGSHGAGTVFRIDAHDRLTVLLDFDGTTSGYPFNLLFGSDGRLYVVCSGGANGLGAILTLDTDGGTVATLHDFAEGDGSYMTSLIAGPGGALFGTMEFGGATNQGTVFTVSPSGQLTTLHEFDSTGHRPSGLAFGGDGNLYGTTIAGSDADWGTVFRLTLGGQFTTVHAFAGSGDGVQPASNLLLASDGSLYGTTPYYYNPVNFVSYLATIFRIDSTGAFSTVHFLSDLFDPGGWLPLAEGADGRLYGPVVAPYAAQVFRVDLDGSNETVYGVASGGDPSWPISNLVQTAAGDLYGVNGAGVVRIDSQGEAVQLSTFPTFTIPGSGLLLGSDGLLYGTTAWVGAGTVWRVDPADSTLTTLHQFTGPDGDTPNPDLIEVAGEIWGSTSRGGANGEGTIFRVGLDGSFADEHDFIGPEGANPEGGLTHASDGTLVGTTAGDGVHNYGTIFRRDAAGAITVLHTFVSNDGPEGGQPNPGVLEASDGAFYGSTQYGGANGWGTLFRFATPDTLTVVYDLPLSSGQDQPFVTPLLIEGAGGIYGTTPGNDQTSGSVFRLDLGGGFTEIYSLQAVNSHPTGALLLGSDGALYGSAGLAWRLFLSTVPAPDSLAIAPTSGRAAGGAAIFIRGHHLRTGATLTVGGTPATSAFLRESAITALTPPFPAGTLQDVAVTNTDATTTTLPGAFFADFTDASGESIFHDGIEAIFRAGITAGCGGGLYCPLSATQRSQMAVFLLRAEHGPGYAPPSCTGTFLDVPCPSPFADWIEALAAEGITGGCGGGDYCPTSPVRRDQMAVFLLKTEHGSNYAPPACNGQFADVPCPSQFADWVEQLAAESITVGCGGGNYCPGQSVRRDQMAAFLDNTLQLP